MVTSLLTSKALRSKYLSPTSYHNAINTNLKAVVIGATSGIGQGCAHRLAEQGYTVLAIGRPGIGRAEQIIEELTAKSKSSAAALAIAAGGAATAAQIPAHEFYATDAFSLQQVHETAQEILSKHPTIDVLVITQGMATTQGFTPTKEGNDEKMTLHYFSRIAIANALLPALLSSSAENKHNSGSGSDSDSDSDSNNARMKKGPVVMSILSGGVHGPYENYQKDFSLEKNYSVKNAADAAGYYNDLGLDQMACKKGNEGINFVHASPGFVNTNWGSEFGTVLRCMVRMMQPLGKSPGDCAEYMLGPTVFASQAGHDLPERLHFVNGNGNGNKGLFVMGEKGQSKSLTRMHTNEAKAFVWGKTVEVLKKAGIDIE